MIGGCGLLSACDVVAFERAVVVGEHLVHVAQGLFEHFEPLLGGGERKAEPAGLLLVPAGADAEDRAAAREHVERGDGLGEHAGLPVDHAGDHGEQLDALGVRGQVAERRVGLEHVVLDRTHVRDLEEVVHHREVFEPGLVRGMRDFGEFGAQLGGPVRPGEIGNL
jgi:hypothetical protein